MTEPKCGEAQEPTSFRWLAVHHAPVRGCDPSTATLKNISNAHKIKNKKILIQINKNIYLA